MGNVGAEGVILALDILIKAHGLEGDQEGGGGWIIMKDAQIRMSSAGNSVSNSQNPSIDDTVAPANMSPNLTGNGAWGSLLSIGARPLTEQRQIPNDATQPFAETNVRPIIEQLIFRPPVPTSLSQTSLSPSVLHQEVIMTPSRNPPLWYN
jgi:hypothetical protein